MRLSTLCSHRGLPIFLSGVLTGLRRSELMVSALNSGSGVPEAGPGHLVQEE